MKLIQFRVWLLLLLEVVITAAAKKTSTNTRLKMNEIRLVDNLSLNGRIKTMNEHKNKWMNFYLIFI